MVSISTPVNAPVPRICSCESSTKEYTEFRRLWDDSGGLTRTYDDILHHGQNKNPKTFTANNKGTIVAPNPTHDTADNGLSTGDLVSSRASIHELQTPAPPLSSLEVSDTLSSGPTARSRNFVWSPWPHWGRGIPSALESLSTSPPRPTKPASTGEYGDDEGHRKDRVDHNSDKNNVSGADTAATMISSAPAWKEAMHSEWSSPAEKIIGAGSTAEVGTPPVVRLRPIPTITAVPLQNREMRSIARHWGGMKGAGGGPNDRDNPRSMCGASRPRSGQMISQPTNETRPKGLSGARTNITEPGGQLMKHPQGEEEGWSGRFADNSVAEPAATAALGNAQDRIGAGVAAGGTEEVLRWGRVDLLSILYSAPRNGESSMSWFICCEWAVSRG